MAFTQTHVQHAMLLGFFAMCFSGPIFSVVETIYWATFTSLKSCPTPVLKHATGCFVKLDAFTLILIFQKTSI